MDFPHLVFDLFIAFHRYGLTFIPQQAGLREWTFISAEAVAWFIKSVDGCNSKLDAVTLGQVII